MDEIPGDMMVNFDQTTYQWWKRGELSVLKLLLRMKMVDNSCVCWYINGWLFTITDNNISRQNSSLLATVWISTRLKHDFHWSNEHTMREYFVQIILPNFSQEKKRSEAFWWLSSFADICYFKAQIIQIYLGDNIHNNIMINVILILLWTLAHTSKLYWQASAAWP